MSKLLGMYILDQNGKPILCEDTLAWAEWYDTADRVVAKTKIGIYEVSTVFLGLDHGFHRLMNPELSPVLWETMVFGEEVYVELLDRMVRKSLDRMDRYTSLEEAKAGHKKMVEWVKENVLPLQVVGEES